jgi:hypothetical protein
MVSRMTMDGWQVLETRENMERGGTTILKFAKTQINIYL